jgi:hypothetical protein
MKRIRQLSINVLIVLMLFSSFLYADTWTANTRFTNTAGYSGGPDIAVNGSNIYVVWSDDTPGNGEIYFKRSIDGGVTWTGNKRLTNTSGESYAPVIAVYRSNVYVVWTDDTPGNGEIYFKRSIDGGVTWTANKRLIAKSTNNEGPAIAVNGPNIYVVWYDGNLVENGIYFKRSVDRGITWSADKRFPFIAGAALSFSPAIAVDDPNIFVVWSDIMVDNDDEICFKRSIDGGVTWKANRTITNNVGDSYAPAIAVNGSNIYVVWEDETPGNREVYFKRSSDRGATWTANRRLTNSTGRSWYPKIAVDGSNVYVVWEDNTPGNSEIYFKKGFME